MTRSLTVLSILLISFTPTFSGAVFNGSLFDSRPSVPRPQEDEDEAAEDEEDEEDEMEMVELSTGPIRVYQTLDGVFESETMYEIETDFDSWSELEIKKIVAQGTKVKKGDTLVEFETEDLEEAIRDAGYDLVNARLDFEEAELVKKQLEKSWEMDMLAAKRQWEQAQEDHKYYWEVEVPQRDKDLEFDMETVGYSLEYAKDELDQLEQMYTEDELTEESEEIVLKRARRSVRSSEWFLEMSKERLNRRKTVTHPRSDVEAKEEFERAELAHAREMIELEGSKKRSEIEFERARIALKEAEEKMEELESDMKKMALKAPAGGVLFYGSCDRGSWSDNDELEPGDSMSTDSVVMTIVKTDDMMIRAGVEEETVSMIKEKLAGTAMVTALGRKTMGVKVDSVGQIPMSDGEYDCTIKIDGKSPSGVIPGMSCKMSFLAYENKRALMAPEASVFTDDDGITHYVYVMKGDEAERVDVKAGHTSGDMIEILDGLKKGDKITAEKP